MCVLYTTMEKEFELIKKHFVGLWKYNKSYSVTICIKGNHKETNPCKTPINALKAALKIIKNGKRI